VKKQKKIKLYKGLTLIEVLLALTLGVLLAIASIFGIRGYIKDSNYRKATMMLNVIRSNINTYRYKNGKYPSTATIVLNTGGQFYSDSPGTFPGDPFSGISTINNDNVTNSKLNPTAPYGGWYYDITSGIFKINLLDSEYQYLFPESPSKW